jgi:hypothetical protein
VIVNWDNEVGTAVTFKLGGYNVEVSTLPE